MTCSISRLRNCARRTSTAGFTLIEVLLVLVILVTLAAIAVPTYEHIRQRAMINAATVQVQLFESAIDTYRMETKRLPDGLGDLIDRPADPRVARFWTGPYLKENRNLTDPWEDPYQYTAKATRSRADYDVWSQGPDAQNGTADDIGNWAAE